MYHIYVKESLGKSNGKHTQKKLRGGAHGGRFQDLETVKTYVIRADGGAFDMDLRSTFDDISQASASVRSTAVCSTTFGRDLLCLLLNLNIISTVAALQAVAQLEVMCPFVSFDQPVHFFPSLAAGIVCYTVSIFLAAIS